MPKTTLKEVKHFVSSNKEKNRRNPPTAFSAADGMKSLIPTAEKNLTDTLIMPDDEIEQSMVQEPILFSNGDMDKNIFSSRTVSPRSSSISLEAEKFLKNVEGNFTIKELSDKLKIPVSKLYYWAKKNQYHPKNGNQYSPVPCELQEKLLKQLSSMSIAELARIYSIPYHVLYHWIKKQGFTAKKSSEFPPYLQQELRKKCQTSSLKGLALEYGLSEQTMRSRLQNIDCFSDGKGGFFITDNLIRKEIIHSYQENGIEETTKIFHTTKIAVKSFLKKYRYYLQKNLANTK